MFAPAPFLDIRSEVLAAAAFGDRPGLGAAELPVVSDAVDSWRRAVILGGQGYYAGARAELRALRALTADPVLRSLAASTEGSLLRQLGWHAKAAVADGRAVALVGGTEPAGAVAEPVDTDALPDLSALPEVSTLAEFAARPDRVDALCDALTGLAADALGTGRLTLAARLLRRGALALDAHHPRARIRWHWVSAETALASGLPEWATTHAEAASALAQRCPSVRHRVKSRLLVAAAAATRGDIDAASAEAEIVAVQCREHGLLPLGWACAMLRSGLGDPDAATEAAVHAAAIAGRGGHFRPMGAR
ncbi:hypothetical protein [Nocardia sp. NPDC050710]|uniref:hypothetical protein n=1 Tax=Nocardia sp. NPDC050710 TaxID=3157220 RepID=UPI0033F7EF56